MKVNASHVESNVCLFIGDYTFVNVTVIRIFIIIWSTMYSAPKDISLVIES